MSKIKETEDLRQVVNALLEHYPPYFLSESDIEELIMDIEVNIMNGWMPYIKWYNKNYSPHIDYEDPIEFIGKVLKWSIEKIKVPSPKIGQSLDDYWKKSWDYRKAHFK